MSNYKEILVNMKHIVVISMTVDTIEISHLDGKCLACRSIMITHI